MADTSITDFNVTVTQKGVMAAGGFRGAAVAAGIKKKAGALDVAVIAADRPVPTAALFTTNLAQAAPVLVSRRHLDASAGMAQAIVINAGCANACTGADGLANATAMAARVAAAIGCRTEEVLVASTGVIGVGLPMEKIVAGIGQATAALSAGTGSDIAQAIMTTDPFPKEYAVTVQTAAGTFTVGGTAKGSGMIEPNMATMLGFLTTDAKVAPALLKRALIECTRDTFNAITVDGDTSTNDCVVAMASGASGVSIDEDLYPALLAGLTSVSRELAIGIVRGGEGATKLVTINVRDARTVADAQRVAKTIANSPLVKTAIHGADPNWGRIVAAAGRAGVPFDINRVTVHVGGVLLFENGLPHDEAAPEAEKHLRGTDIGIDVHLGTGGGAHTTVWTCDLTAEYVKINGEYRT
jgi:glutamate N-acetyltransferase / amino-acid N-acetyltransferase